MGIRKHFEKKGEGDLKLQDLSLEQEEAKPELKFDPETEISETDWQEMKNSLESDRQNNSWWGFAEQAMRLKILFPDRTAELNLDSAWQGMKNRLEVFRRSYNWRNFAEQARSFKILFPNRKAELDLNDSAWQGMKDDLESDRRNNNWGTFTEQAMRLKILAADKVETTDQGLEITMRPPESFKSPKKPRPERKAF